MKIRRTHEFLDLLVPVAHPTTHDAIVPDLPCTTILVPSHVGISTSTYIKRTTATSNMCLPRFIIIPFPVLFIHISPLPRRTFSDGMIGCLPSTSVWFVWKIAKYSIQRLTLHRIKVWICAMEFSPIVHQHSWNCILQPFTGFHQFGLSWLSCCANVPPGRSASLLTLVNLITNAFFHSDFLVVIDWYMYNFHLLY